MNYKSKIMDYLDDNFNGTDLYQMMGHAVMELKDQHHKSWQFIFKAITSKPVEDWINHNSTGLLFHRPYWSYIDNSIRLEKEQKNFNMSSFKEYMNGKDTDQDKPPLLQSPTAEQDFKF